jgi:hypothetical protein
MVFLRTELIPDYIGKIFIPPQLRASYSHLPHKVMLYGMVLSTGPKCTSVKKGDRIAFSRLFFARWQYMPDQTLVGWINEDNIALELDQGIAVRQVGDHLQTPSGERANAR